MCFLTSALSTMRGQIDVSAVPLSKRLRGSRSLSGHSRAKQYFTPKIESKFLGIKQPEGEADEPPPPSAGIQNAWNCSPSLLCLNVVVLRHRNKFYVF